jgi:hypothetical protein
MRKRNLENSIATHLNVNTLLFTKKEGCLDMENHTLSDAYDWIQFPSSRWKKAMMIMIIKELDHVSMSNYRKRKGFHHNNYLFRVPQFFFFSLKTTSETPPPHGAGVGNSIGPNILRASWCKMKQHTTKHCSSFLKVLYCPWWSLSFIYSFGWGRIQKTHGEDQTTPWWETIHHINKKAYIHISIAHGHVRNLNLDKLGS